MSYQYNLNSGLTRVQTNTKKYVAVALVGLALVLSVSVPALAVSPGAAVKNPNANANACWGQDRSYYASQKFFPENMDIKQSFPNGVNPQLQDWVATYCEPHGPAQQ